MLKRMIAWVLVLALLVSVMPELSMGVTAEGTAAPPAEHSHSAAQHDCEHCDASITWEVWDGTAEMKDGGHYYLAGDVKLKASTTISSGDSVVLCLNGYSINGGYDSENLSNSKSFSIFKVQGELTVADCTAYTDQDGVCHAGAIQNGYFTGGQSGAIYVAKDAKLTMHAGILDNNHNIMSGKDAVEKNVGYGGGAIHVRGKATVTLNNVVFSNNTTNMGGAAIATRTSATLRITNCSFVNNTSGADPALGAGGAIYLNAGTATLDSCTFTTNKAAKGGAVYATASTLTMTSCVMDGNKSTATSGSGAGGALYLHSTTAELDTCTISNSVATVAGGSAIYTTNSSDVTLKDCTVTGNEFTGTSTSSRAAIYMTKATDKLTVSGKTVIDGNTMATDGTAVEAPGVFLQAAGDAEAPQVNVGGLTEGANISIYTRNWTAEDADDLVTADAAPTTWNRLWVVYNNNGKAVDHTAADGFVFATNTDHIHCECGDLNCAETGQAHEKIEYLPWNGETRGDYYLTDDVKLTETVEVDGELSLCLHGYDITAEEGGATRFFNLRGTDELTITDCQSEPGKVSGAKSSAVMLENNAESKTVFNLYNGIFTENSATAGGGAVLVQGSGTFNMYGGTLTGNTVAAEAKVDADGDPVLDSKNVQTVSGQYGGGAVMLFKENATFNMYGGTISGNSVTSCQRQKADGTLETVGGTGGAIYTEGAVNLYGGTVSGNKADRNGGGIYATGKGAAVKLEGCELSGNEANSGGAIITVNESRLELISGKVTGNTADNGGGVYISTNTTLTMTGGEISGNTAAGNGGGIYLYRSEATLSGGTVSGNTAVNGGGILCEGAVLYLKGTNIIANTATANGGGVKTALASKTYPAKVVISGGAISQNTATLAAGVLLEGAGSGMTMTGGEITGNTATDQAGGIWVSTNTTWTMEGGKISGNTAVNGGGIVLYKTTATVTGGEITGNAATKNGGGIKCDQSTLQLSGGTVTGNTAGSAGAGVYLPENSTLELSGEPEIIGNTVNDKANNLYLCGNVLMRLGELGENARIAVSADTAFRAISQEHGTDDSGKFSSDKSNLQVEYRNKALYLGAAGDHKHCLCNGTVASGCSHNGVLFAAWDDPASLPASGSWYLTADVTVSSVTEVTGELNLCLNGHNITVKEGAVTRVYTLRGTGALSIADCQEKPGRISGAKTSAVLMENKVESKTVFNLYNGTFTGNTATAGGGAVLVQGSGTFNMYGGSLTGNTVTAAAKVDAAGKPVLDSSNVQTVTGQYGGGAVMLYGGNATFNLYGGTISDNHVISCQRQKADGTLETVGGKGGAIYAEGTVNIHGGTIIGNTADVTGGAIYATDKGTVVTVSGGELSGNEAKTAGGAILLATRSHLELTGGKVTGNKAANGGGMYISTNTTFNMTGGEVSGNTAASYGGGIYLLRSEANLSGGQVSGNEAANGGGIQCGGATLNLMGTNIIQNAATKNGGGVKTAVVKTTSQTFVPKIVLSTGAISQNTAALGGGILLEGAGGEMTMTGGEISQNSATDNAGGIWVSTKAVWTMEGGKISGNTANNGGGIVIFKAAATFSGGEISGNKAKTNAGGAYIRYDTSNAVFQNITITGNSAANGGGVLVANGATLVMKSGTVSGNTATKNGGGMYISTKSGLEMSGGSITGNIAKTTGAGLYGLQATMTLSGGSVSYNKATKNGGGVHISGGALYLYGTYISGNTAKEGTGGGVNSTRRVVTKNGVETSYPATIVLNGSLITDNTAQTAGGILMAGNGGSMEMHSGAITGNTSVKQGGGLYVSAKTTFTMTGGTIAQNESGQGGGGIYQNKSVGNYTGGEIHSNTAESAGGAVYFTSSCTGDFKNVSIYGNTAKTVGGALYINNDVPCNITDSEFYGNTAGTRGGAIYGAPGAGLVVTNSSFTDNEAIELGGALCVRDIAALTDCVLTGNKAEKGGAIYAGNTDKTYAVNGWGTKGSEVGVVVRSCTVSDNHATSQGGGLYLTMSAFTDMQDTVITGNTSGGEGSGIWAEDDLTMINVSVTGNASENSGYAVYLSDSEYDGQTYIKGLMKMGGDMIIRDNRGGDMFLGNKVTVGALSQGYGEKTHVSITLDAGLLTQRVYGSYNYEGGNCVYTITYGDRSLTEPEYEAPVSGETEPTEGTEGTQATEPANENTLLYAGVGAFAVVIAAIAVIVVLLNKKKKAGKTAEEVAQD